MSADFWMGTTIGAAVVLVILLAIVFGAGSANEKKAKARNSEATELLRARNRIGVQQFIALDRIAEAMIAQRKFEVETLRQEKAEPYLLDALRESVAGLELACAKMGYDTGKTDGFIPSPVLALRIARAAIAKATGQNVSREGSPELNSTEATDGH